MFVAVALFSEAQKTSGDDARGEGKHLSQKCPFAAVFSAAGLLHRFLLIILLVGS